MRRETGESISLETASAYQHLETDKDKIFVLTRLIF